MKMSHVCLFIPEDVFLLDFVRAHKVFQVLKVKSAAANVKVIGPSTVPRLLTGVANEALPANDHAYKSNQCTYVMWTDVTSFPHR